MRFRTLTFIFVTKHDVFWKHLKIVVSAGVWILLSQSITAGRCETKKLYGHKQTVPRVRHLNIMHFSKILTLVTVSDPKITKFVRWRDFNALRRAHVSFTWFVEWLHPKNNIVYRGNCSTKGGRTIHALSNFDRGVRDHKWCILKTFEGRCVRRCLDFIFWKYHGWTLRNGKVTRA